MPAPSCQNRSTDRYCFGPSARDAVNGDGKITIIIHSTKIIVVIYQEVGSIASTTDDEHICPPRFSRSIRTRASRTEAEVLWEYAKLNQRLKIITAETKRSSRLPEERLLRNLETKMGFMLTLLQASVWGVIKEQAATADARGDADLNTTADKTAVK